MQIGKWSETSDLIIAVLKVFSTKLLVMIWPIVVAIFSVTLVGLFMVGIIPFWYIKFKKSWTFLLLSWSKRLRLKPPEYDNVYKFSNGSILPLGGL